MAQGDADQGAWNFVKGVGGFLFGGGQTGYRAKPAELDTTRIDEERVAALQARQGQGALATALQRQAAGQGPSLAGVQLRQGLQQAQAQAAQQAAAGRGVNRALAARGALNAQATLAAQAQQAGAQARVAEQLGAQSALANVLQAQRAQDLTARGFSTQEQQMLMDSRMRAQEINAGIEQGNAADRRGVVNSVLGGIANLSDMDAKTDIQPLNTAQQEADEQLRRQQEELERQRMFRAQMETQQAAERGGKGSGIGSIIGGILSDRESKEKISALSAALEAAGAATERGIRDPQTPQGSREALGPVEPFTFRYKPEFAAAQGTDTAPRPGVMAQDLERSPVLRSAVVQTPLGKALDRDRLLQADTALLAGLDKRLRKLEGGKAAR